MRAAIALVASIASEREALAVELASRAPALVAAMHVRRLRELPATARAVAAAIAAWGRSGQDRTPRSLHHAAATVRRCGGTAPSLADVAVLGGETCTERIGDDLAVDAATVVLGDAEADAGLDGVATVAAAALDYDQRRLTPLRRSPRCSRADRRRPCAEQLS